MEVLGLTTRCKGLAGIVVGDCGAVGREPLIGTVRRKMDTLAVILVAAALLALVFVFRRTRLLAIVPRISRDGEKLIARTSIGGLLLSLTLLYRTIVVDPNRQTVSISTRVFWIIRRLRTIPFTEIEKIIYRYQDLNPSSSLGFSGDSKDWYSVKLRLNRDREIHLFHFLGEGEFHHGTLDWLPEWMYWSDRLFDMRGTQDDDSRSFVKQLERMIGEGTVN